MNGWNEHAYENVPAVARVTVADAPGWIAPVSKLPALVAVCGWSSSFVNVTVVPTATRISAGPNVKSLMTTVFAPAAIGALLGEAAIGALLGALAIGADVVAGFESLPQALSANAAAAPTPRDSRRMFTSLLRCGGVGG
jgi:hypothetical protein